MADRMKVGCMDDTLISILDDFEGWLRLAQEVEPLFGPMVQDPDFRKGLRQAILDGHALCVRTEAGSDEQRLLGGIVIAPKANEILWFAVTKEKRGKGIGRTLLQAAIEHLDKSRPIIVTTFDQTVAAGTPARNLYHTVGFREFSPAGANPAGIPTVTMLLIKPHDEPSS